MYGSSYRYAERQAHWALTGAVWGRQRQKRSLNPHEAKQERKPVTDGDHFSLWQEFKFEDLHLYVFLAFHIGIAKNTSQTKLIQFPLFSCYHWADLIIKMTSPALTSKSWCDCEPDPFRLLLSFNNPDSERYWAFVCRTVFCLCERQDEEGGRRHAELLFLADQ